MPLGAVLVRGRKKNRKREFKLLKVLRLSEKLFLPLLAGFLLLRKKSKLYVQYVLDCSKKTHCTPVVYLVVKA